MDLLLLTDDDNEQPVSLRLAERPLSRVGYRRNASTERMA